MVIDLPPGSIFHGGGNPAGTWDAAGGSQGMGAVGGTGGMILTGNIWSYNRGVSGNTNAVVDTRLDAAPPASSGIFASQISLTAEYVNLNGLIQSGFEDYTITINAAVAADIEKIKADIKSGKLSGGLVELTRASANGFKVFWDSENGRIVLQEFRTPGGSITITGKLMNTGNGSIKALGGYANVVVNNSTGFDVVVKRIDVSERGTGKVVLNDRSKGSQAVGRTGRMAAMSAPPISPMATAASRSSWKT